MERDSSTERNLREEIDRLWRRIERLEQVVAQMQEELREIYEEDTFDVRP